MDYVEYLFIAARHSRYNAARWFRYLRKIIDKYGIAFTQEQINYLYNSDELTPFQRVSLKAAFKEGSITRQYLLNLNQIIAPTKPVKARGKHDR